MPSTMFTTRTRTRTRINAVQNDDPNRNRNRSSPAGKSNNKETSGTGDNKKAEAGERRIVKYDNLGDPVYDDEGGSDGSGITVLGANVNVDPLTSALLIFGLIAFNFFVLANL